MKNNGVIPMENKNGLYHGVSNDAKKYNINPRKNDILRKIPPRKNVRQDKPLPSSMEESVPWANYGVFMNVIPGISPRKTANDSNGVPLDLSGITPRTIKDKAEFAARITPRKNESKNKFFTGITPRKNECYIKYVASPGRNADYLAKITPRKNEIFNLAPAVTNRYFLTGITPWEAPNNNPLPSKLEDGVPWAISRMDVLK